MFKMVNFKLEISEYVFEILRTETNASHRPTSVIAKRQDPQQSVIHKHTE